LKHAAGDAARRPSPEIVPVQLFSFVEGKSNTTGMSLSKLAQICNATTAQDVSAPAASRNNFIRYLVVFLNPGSDSTFCGQSLCFFFTTDIATA
jgi:hypothetical protein